MQKLLTTGELIDQLQVGENAETISGKYQATKTEHGQIVIKNEHGNVGLNAIVLGSTWRILPKYVSFHEALEALKTGKRITSHCTECSIKTFQLVDGKVYSGERNVTREDTILIERILNGKWTIEN